MILPGTRKEFNAERKDREGFIKHEGEEWTCTMPVI
jgi:hypothetical protein